MNIQNLDHLNRNDSWIFDGVTGAPSLNEPVIFFADIHYQSTGIGTKQKAPNFWV